MSTDNDLLEMDLEMHLEMHLETGETNRAIVLAKDLVKGLETGPETGPDPDQETDPESDRLMAGKLQKEMDQERDVGTDRVNLCDAKECDRGMGVVEEKRVVSDLFLRNEWVIIMRGDTVP